MDPNQMAVLVRTTDRTYAVAAPKTRRAALAAEAARRGPGRRLLRGRAARQAWRPARA
jgi:hypothetical protein